MNLRMAEVYVDAQGRLTQAGWQALQGALDAQAGRIAVIEANLAAAAAVANATGGATVDTQARAELVAIKAALT